MNLPKDVVLFSTADWDNPSWTNKQHMACELADRGFRVLYIESLGLRRPSTRPWDLRRLGRRLFRGLGPLRTVREGVSVLSPLVLPFHSHPWIGRLNQRLLERRVADAVRQLGMRDPMLWTYHPLIPRIPHSLLVYHCVDDLASAPRMPSDMLRRAETELLREADVVFATSRRLALQCGAEAHYLPNVVDFAHFSRAREAGPIPADLAAIPRPRVGFIGAVSEYKVDFDLIAQVARLRPDLHWVLVGTVGEGQPWTRLDKMRLPNIHFLGHKAYAELPDYLRGFDVAAILAQRNAYTQSMFPMKFFEYLAAGRPVIAGETPALDEFREAFWHVSGTDEVVESIDEILSAPQRRQSVGIALASRYTWSWRTDRMLEILSASGQSRRRLAA